MQQNDSSTSWSNFTTNESQPKLRKSRLVLREYNFSNYPGNCASERDQKQKSNLNNFSNFVDIYDSSLNLPYSLIASSHHSKIFLTQNSQNNKLYIKKTIDLSLQPKYKGILKLLLQFHKLYSHKNIMNLYSSSIESKTQVHLIYDYAQKGTWQSVLIKSKAFDEWKAFSYFYQIWEAVHYLHCNNIILRNLSPDNIWVAKNDVVLLSNFKMIKNLNENANNKFYDYSGDLCALGVVLYSWTQGIQNQSELKERKFNCNISPECEELIRDLIIGVKYTKVEDIYLSKWIVKHMSSPTFNQITKAKDNINNSLFKTKFVRRRSKSENVDNMDSINNPNCNDEGDFSFIESWKAEEASFYQKASNDTRNNEIFKTYRRENCKVDLLEINSFNMIIKKVEDAQNQTVTKPKDPERDFWDSLRDFFIGSCN